MYREVFDEVIRLAQRRRARDRITRRLEAGDAQLQELLAHLDQLEREVMRAEEGAGRGARRTLASAVATLLRRHRDLAPDRRRHEAAEARLRYEGQREAFEGLERELAELRDKLAEYAEVDAEYERAFVEKANALVAAGGAGGVAVAEAGHRLVDARAQLRGIDDALKAGRDALRHLSFVDRRLNTADLYGPGSFIDSAVVQDLFLGQRLIYRFAREIEDIEPSYDDSPSMVTTAALLDRFVADAVSRTHRDRRYATARNAAQALRREVDRLAGDLDNLRDTLAADIESINARYTELVTRA